MKATLTVGIVGGPRSGYHKWISHRRVGPCHNPGFVAAIDEEWVMNGMKQIEETFFTPSVIHSDSELTYLSEPYVFAFKRLKIQHSYCCIGNSLATALSNAYETFGKGLDRKKHLGESFTTYGSLEPFLEMAQRKQNLIATLVEVP